MVATEKGLRVLEQAYQYNKDMIGLVTTFEEVNVLESFSKSIQDFCWERNLQFMWWKDIKNILFQQIESREITAAFAIGWRYLLPLTINDYLQTNLIIFHDSLLPKYRGFAPTATALICGEREIGMSVLFAAEKMDTGDIILQKSAVIDPAMYIKDAIGVQSQLYQEAFTELMERIIRNDVVGIPQDETKATYSIWRDSDDCRIDWSLPSNSIFNLIRAVNFPYTGAFTYYDRNKIFVWRAEVVPDIRFETRDPGKIWEITAENNPIVVCGEGMLKLTDVTDQNHNQIQFTALRKRFGLYEQQ
jgi:methionyl-tRNA formyltransferase